MRTHPSQTHPTSVMSITPMRIRRLGHFGLFISRLNPRTKAPPRVPARKQKHSSRNRRKLQNGKVNLVRLQLSKQSLRSLSQTERSTHVHQARRNGKHARKTRQFASSHGASGSEEERAGNNDKHPHREDLVRQPTEEDVIGSRGILMLGGLGANHRRTSDLGDGSDDIRRDEEPHDELWRQEGILGAETRNERRQNGVDARGEEDGRGNDEEVVEDKVNEVVGVLLGRQAARHVSHNLEEQADGEGGKPPAAVSCSLDAVDHHEGGEPDRGEDGEGKGRREAVDDDGDIPFAVWVGEVGVHVAVGLVFYETGLVLFDGEREWYGTDLEFGWLWCPWRSWVSENLEPSEYGDGGCEDDEGQKDGETDEEEEGHKGVDIVPRVYRNGQGNYSNWRRGTKVSWLPVWHDLMVAAFFCINLCEVSSVYVLSYLLHQASLMAMYVVKPCDPSNKLTSCRKYRPIASSEPRVSNASSTRRRTRATIKNKSQLDLLLA